MRRPQGYAVLTIPEGAVIKLGGLPHKEVPAGVMELDTVSCGHCNRVTHVMPRMDPADMGGLCKICYGLICKFCVGRGCDPLEAKLERAEARYHALRSYAD